MKLIVFITICFLSLSIGAQTFIWPLANGGKQWTSSKYGDRQNPLGGGGSGFHDAYDIAAIKGTPVLAVADGIIISCYPAPNGYFKGDYAFGGMIVLRLFSGIDVRYGHLSKVYVVEGKKVKTGDVIGAVGSTGFSTGNHLHFELMMDPASFFKKPEPEPYRDPFYWRWTK